MVFAWDPHSVVAVGLGAMAIQAVFFVFAASFRTDKVTDLSYSLSFVSLTLVLFLLAGPTPTRALVSVAVVLWGLRLGAYLLRRVIRTGRDERFDSMRGRVARFAAFWLFQGITVWVVMIPTTVVLSASALPGLEWSAFVGGALWLVGFCLEWVADTQKYRFRNDPANTGRWMDSGLWRYSRHPNYFGEILCWVGLSVVSTRFLSGWLWLTLLCPLFLALLLLFVSGIPTVEKRSDKRYGAHKEYQEYKRTTSALVPLPRRR